MNIMLVFSCIPHPQLQTLKRLINICIFIFFCMLILCIILRATLDKGPKSRVQWNLTLILVKNFKLVPRPLNKGPRPRQIKLWFSLHGIILEGKPIGLNPKKIKIKENSWFGEPKCKIRFKVTHFFVFNLFHYCFTLGT
jgi:hypothetical protein